MARRKKGQPPSSAADEQGSGEPAAAESVRALLDAAEAERAEASRAEVEEGASEAIESLFLFEVAGLRLATQSAYVEAVSEVEEATPVPGCPDYVLGVAPHGEEILPILDLSRLLDLSGETTTDPLYQRTLVVRTRRFVVGMRVDRARGLSATPASKIRPPSVLMGERLRRFTNGEIEEEDGVIGVLDVPALLRAAAVT